MSDWTEVTTSVNDANAGLTLTPSPHVRRLNASSADPWDSAYFNNGAAVILDEIPVRTREQEDQVAFRSTNSVNNNGDMDQVGCMV